MMSQKSEAKNSVVASFFSFVDFYRPRFVIMENVRGLANYDQGLVLQLVLNALVCMGYQVAYSVLQAGHYGVPQSRKRLIIIAVAPGEPLPLFPEPTYVCAAPHFSGPHFPRVTVSGWTVDPSGGEMPAGAPRRCITVWDVISDLPETAVQIQGGSADRPAAVPYASQPISHLQQSWYRKEVRKNDPLEDHMVRKVKLL